ncbi:DegT/DnrJ/EryC1/StrS family aminotransferase, partial [Escherichia coli]|nr:DegT/DnrJ/EryC1/StrS family aminotransferase [Escherichia coli]
PQELEARNNLATQYTEALRGIYKTPVVPEGYFSSWAQYTIIADDRDMVMNKCKEQGVPTMVYYTTCLHLQTAFEKLGYHEGCFP